MDTSTLDFNTLTLLVTIAASWLTTITVIIRQSNRHEDSIKALDTKFTDKIDALDTKFTDRIDALDTKFTDRIDALDTKFTDRIDALDGKFTDRIDALGGGITEVRERLGRVEGYLMGPESFAPRRPERDDPAPDHRAAG